MFGNRHIDQDIGIENIVEDIGSLQLDAVWDGVLTYLKPAWKPFRRLPPRPVP